MEIKEIYNPSELEDGAVFVTTQEEEIKSDILERRATRGRVRWFDRSLGYGFLWEDGFTKEIFVHQSSIQVPGVKKLRKGQRVVFDLCLTASGEVALNVIPIFEREGLLEKCRARALKAERQNAEPVKTGRGRRKAAAPSDEVQVPSEAAPKRRGRVARKKQEDEEKS